jgi:hypothetical protein
MTGLLNASGVSDDDMKTEEFGDYKLSQDSVQATNERTTISPN